MDIYREHITEYEDRLKEFFAKPKALQRYLLIGNHVPTCTYRDVVVTDKYAVIECGHITPVRGLRGIFPHRCIDFKWVYSASIKRCPTVKYVDKYTIKSILSQCSSKYCFVKDIPEYVLSGRIVKDILYGKITNPHTAIIHYGKMMGIKNLNKEVFDVASKLGISPMVIISSLDINQLQSCYNAIIDRVDHSYDFSHTFKDMLEQAYALEEKVNLLWSDNKMGKVHTEWSRQLMKLDLDNKETIPIWPDDVVEELKQQGLELLNTEQRVFEEGYMMSNCVYTNYWHRIKFKKTLALGIEFPGGHATLGLTLNTKRKGLDSKPCSTYVFEQCYHKYNKNLSAKEGQWLLLKLVEIEKTLEKMANTICEEPAQLEAIAPAMVADIPW